MISFANNLEITVPGDNYTNFNIRYDSSNRSDYKPMPPPKTSSYRPTPPPKPKSSRGPPPPPGEPYRHLRGPAVDSAGGGLDSPLRQTPDWRDSREELAGGFPPLSSNGAHDDAGGFDSGHGSSLDRNYDVTGRTYINMKPTGYYGGGPPVREGAGSQPGGLDLANRDQRGSAFELYRKPADPRFPYIEHGAR